MAAAARVMSTDSYTSAGSFENYDSFDEDDDYDEEDFCGAAAMEEDETEVAEVLTPAELIRSRLESIESVNTVFQISPGIARLLLAHFKWDKERLIERYYSGDQEKLFQEAHVVNPWIEEDTEERAEQKERECQICWSDFRNEEMTGLLCKHTFCETCWAAYLKTKILVDGTAEIACPEYGCDILVDELTVSRLISDDRVLSKYQYLVAKAFVSDNKHIQWCPSPGCENALKLPLIKSIDVSCKCGMVFCFTCQQPAHKPIHCAMLKRWLKKCADDSETSNWIATNTKECPKCKSTIEKNGGCNHMTCRTGRCGYEFCWVCLGPWSEHGSSWYNCSRFEEAKGSEARSEMEKSRHSLQRYLHYYNRYSAHEQSRKLEGKLIGMVKEKQKQLMSGTEDIPGMTWIEVQFLSDALAILSSCRNTLQHTYVFAYYLEKNIECDIFETNQKDLEMATETLSGYLEGEANDEDLRKLKQKVMDKSKYCEQRRIVLLEHVEEGVLAQKWKFVPASMHEEMYKAYYT